MYKQKALHISYLDSGCRPELTSAEFSFVHYSITNNQYIYDSHSGEEIFRRILGSRVAFPPAIGHIPEDGAIGNATEKRLCTDYYHYAQKYYLR